MGLCHKPIDLTGMMYALFDEGAPGLAGLAPDDLLLSLPSCGKARVRANTISLQGLQHRRKMDSGTAEATTSS